jgi:acetyl esterase/lipase
MIDPELAAFADLIPPFDLSDPVAARAGFEALIGSMAPEVPGIETLDITDRRVAGWEDDPEVSIRVYAPKVRSGTASPPVPGILTIHGGGFMIGSVETEHVGSAMMALETGAMVVSVDYRLAPEHPFPAAVHDCYAALQFLQANAASLGVDPARVALAGMSAGGGLAAATALLARDLGGPDVCFQLLQIPELDDRLETPSMQAFTDSPVWNRPLAVESWRAYLGPMAEADEVSAYAAPARATDLSGLPPAYISTAEADPLRDEGILYGLRLLQAGVSVELHQFPGTFHGSALVMTAAISRRAHDENVIVLRRALGID